MNFIKNKFKHLKNSLFLSFKYFLQFVRANKNKKDILFIVGCPRSGTTMLFEIFERDLDSKTYGEFSKLSSQDKLKIRLNPLENVKDEIYSNPAEFIVLKPLVESQNILKLLNYFDNSKAIWIFRNYKDVASSNLKYFGIKNGINDLAPIVKGNKLDWRAEGVSDELKELILKYFSEDMNPYDAAVLFWYVRNTIFFELNLENDQRIMLCRYEDLVTDPEKILKMTYSFIGRKFPGNHIIKKVHSSALGKGSEINISPEIETLAETMQQKLMAVYNSKTNIYS